MQQQNKKEEIIDTVLIRRNTKQMKQDQLGFTGDTADSKRFE